MATKTLYVGNLPYSTTETELNAHFSAYGGQNSRILEGRGFGFVDVEADKMDDAINEKHNAELGGRRLTVNEARPRAGGGGSGGGRTFAGGGGGGSRPFPPSGGEERDFGGGDRGGFGGRGGGGGDRGGGDRSRGGKGKDGRTPRW